MKCTVDFETGNMTCSWLSLQMAVVSVIILKSNTDNNDWWMLTSSLVMHMVANVASWRLVEKRKSESSQEGQTSLENVLALTPIVQAGTSSLLTFASLGGSFFFNNPVIPAVWFALSATTAVVLSIVALCNDAFTGCCDPLDPPGESGVVLQV